MWLTWRATNSYTKPTIQSTYGCMKSFYDNIYLLIVVSHMYNPSVVKLEIGII